MIQDLYNYYGPCYKFKVMIAIDDADLSEI